MLCRRKASRAVRLLAYPQILNTLGYAMIKSTTRKFKQPHLNLVLLLLIGVGMSILTSSPAQANASASTWTDPVNLSYSGAASSPLLIADSTGEYHVLWQDTFDGFVYTRGSGERWQAPQIVTMPFSSPPFSRPGIEQTVNLYTPLLKIDDNDIAHAFWLNDVGVLLYSQVPVADIDTAASWLAPRQLAESASSFDVVIDGNDRLHLSYVRIVASEQFPAGIYHRRSADGGNSWSDPYLLYESRYLRLATRAESNIRITVNNERLAVVWDNRLVEAVYFASSTDAGMNWTLAQSIDQRTESEMIQTVSPKNIAARLLDGITHLVWLASNESGRCALYHQLSIDNGQTWSQRLVVTDDRDCPENVRLVAANNTLFVAYTLRQQVLFQGWTGTQWTPRVVQTRLSSFTNPDSRRTVSLGCLQLQIVVDRLTALGCGLGAVQDIWLMSYPVQALLDQISAEAEVAWVNIAPISHSLANKSNPVLLTTEDGRFHAFWIEKLGSVTGEDTTFPGEGIYYSFWNGHDWRRPAPIYLGEHIDQLAATIYNEERFILVWRDPVQEALVMGQAEINQARIPVHWSPAKELVTEKAAISNLTLTIGHDRAIYLVYAVALNEGRGLYVVDSKDGGFAWSAPRLIFNAEEKGWRRIDQPQVTVSEDGRMHLLFNQYSLTASLDRPSAIYYTYSVDEDLNQWSEADLVAEGIVAWGQVVSTSNGQVHRLWQERIGERISLWFQTSTDNGASWSNERLIPAFDDLPGILSVRSGIADQIHLIQLTNDLASPRMLREWLHKEERWQTVSFLDLPSMMTNPWDSPAVAASQTGQLGVLYPGVWENTGSGRSYNNLFFTSRMIALADDYVPPTLPAPTPAPEISDDPGSSDSASIDAVAPLATPEPRFEFDELEASEVTPLQIGGIDLRTPSGGLFLGIVLSSLLVISAFSISYYTRRSR